MSWTTPGQGYNFNEPLSEGAKEVAKEYPRDREWQKLVRKHSRSIEKFQKTGNFDRKAEEELVSWAMDNGEIRTDDVDETDEWLHDVILSNSYIPEGEPIIENLLMEKPYDKADVKKVQKLEIQFEKLLKEVDKTIRGSGLSAPAFSMVRSGVTKGLEAIKKFYSIAHTRIISNMEQNESIDEGMMDLDKARKLPQKVQDQILDAKKEYDRTWDGVFVPMGKEGSTQRKEYERRGALFKAASAKYKALLKRHKVATFK